MPRDADLKNGQLDTIAMHSSERSNAFGDVELSGIAHWNLRPWLIFGIGAIASALLFNFARGAIDDVARLRFERQARDAVAIMEERIQFYSDILYGLRALFSSRGMVSRLQFNRFVAALDLKDRFPGFDVVNYAAYVPAHAKEQFIESVRRDTSLDPLGYPHFDIRPAGERPEYFVLAYVEPMQGFEFAFGRDLGANLDAAEPQHLVVALHAARDSGELTASGVPIRIKRRDREYTGLAMRLAVYRSGMPLRTVDERRAAYIGSVGAGFNIDDLMKGVLNESSMKFIRLQVHDVRPAAAAGTQSVHSDRRRLFDSAQPPAGAAAPDLEPAGHLSQMLSIQVGGRIWEIQFSAPKVAVIDRVDALLPWAVLAAGLLLSALLAGMFFSLSSSRSRALAIAQEITRDLRESEKELRASGAQLQALSHRLVELQESERRQLARELHDRVGQNLTALSISLDILRTQTGAGDATAMRSRLDDASALLDSTAGVIENVMEELRPPMLDDYGLAPALEWYANQFCLRTGIHVAVKCEGEAHRAPATIEIALFRIVQEALNNVVKHAGASSVTIALHGSQDHLALAVTDNGAGYDPAVSPNTRRRQGLGMVTMRERAEALGGTFDIDAAPGRGTSVRIRVPR